MDLTEKTRSLWPKIEIQDGGRPQDFLKIWFLSIGTPWAADFPSRYKIWCKNVDRRRNYGPKSKSKMAAVRHLGFVTSSYRTTHQVFSLGHIGHIGLSNFMLIPCIVLKIWQFEISKKNLISEHWDPLGCRFPISVQNFVQKCWSTPKLWPNIEIQDGGRPPSWIFENLISEHWDPLGCRFSITV